MGTRVTSLGVALLSAAMTLSPSAAMSQELVRIPSRDGAFSQSVRVQRGGLLHTGMILARGSGDVRRDTADLMRQLSALAQRNSTSLSRVARLNLYVAPEVEGRIGEVLNEAQRAFATDERPALTLVPSKLPGAGTTLALDAVLRVERDSQRVVVTDDGAVLPPGRDVLFVSGRAAAGELPQATDDTMEQLLSVVRHFGSGPEDVVQVKAFLTPMANWEAARDRIAAAFGDRPTPPVVYVEWTSASRPTEIELIAVAPEHLASGESVTFVTPPGDSSSPVFSRVARLHSDEVIYIGGLSGGSGASADLEVRSAISELNRVALAAGSDLRHLAKATYYVSTDEASSALGKLRPDYYDPNRPPAASKVPVPSIGVENRGLLLDMVAGPAPADFLHFIQAQAAASAGLSEPPSTAEAWNEQREVLRRRLSKAWGGFPEQHVALEPRVVGTLERQGYRVEKLVFQTLPNVWMTANVYVPVQPGGDATRRHPAVLCVHGHWRGAKQDPHVQARCIGLVKLGFVVLAVDAFGAGERGVGRALGEYHGEMVAGTLWPVGRPLSGLQVYENSRAVDYLQSRPDVDGERIGITGASGGGNQTMYAGAWDPRFKAVVPVCSVGNYQAYLGAACCMCEVVPGALQFTEEWGVLSLTAPRALMVISATRDAFQFSVGEAGKSLARVRTIYELAGQPDNVRHAVFESPHDYNQPMREAMYGWMTLHLKGQGDGQPIPEPDMETEEPEVLRCFPGESRPDDWVTIPRFAALESQRLLERHEVPTEAGQWASRRQQLLNVFDRETLGGTATAVREFTISPARNSLQFTPERGIRLTLQAAEPLSADNRCRLLVLTVDDSHDELVDQLRQQGQRAGGVTVSLQLRGTGRQSVARDQIGRAPDHNSGEWSLWIGRPLLGQWVRDARSALDALESAGVLADDVTVVGVGPAGLVAVSAAAVDARIKQAVSAGSLSSFVTDAPYENQRLGMLPAGVLRDAGDIAQIAALVAPRKLTIAGGVNAQGRPLSEAELARNFEWTRAVYSLAGAADSLTISADADADELWK